MKIYYFALLIAVGVTEAVDRPSLRAPDPACREAFQDSKQDDESCLEAADQFGRPCELCIRNSQKFCYNYDEARWAKFFGASCSVEEIKKEGLDRTIDPD